MPPGNQPSFSLGSQTLYPETYYPEGSNLYWKGEFRLSDIPLNGVNRNGSTVLQFGYTWQGTALTDAILCTATVTDGTRQSTINCVDGNRASDTVIQADSNNGVEFISSNSTVSYYTLNNLPYMSVNAGFIR